MYKKLFLFLLFIIFSHTTFAAGGITHMMIAKESIEQLPDVKLKNLLYNHIDAYLVGANYPDSGYVDGTHYGEDSHWEPFITTFIRYLRDKYAFPEEQAPDLVAFLMGCATHSMSDIVFHWTFLNKVAAEDFHGNWDTAQDYGDRELDLFILVDKNQWAVRPKTWWVPVEDLVEIYHRMNRDQYTANEIKYGNSIFALSGIGERMIALSAYPIIKWKMPWTTNHYYDAEEGGILQNEKKVAEYLQNVWERLLGKTSDVYSMKFVGNKPIKNNQSVSFVEADAWRVV